VYNGRAVSGVGRTERHGVPSPAHRPPPGDRHPPSRQPPRAGPV